LIGYRSDGSMPTQSSSRLTWGRSRPQTALLPDCCPWTHSEAPAGTAAERLPWSELTRPPVIRGFALCLPLTERGPLSLRGSRVVEHDGMRPKGRQREQDLACGQSRAWLLTGAGTAVDNRVAGWGRPRGREIPLPIPSCSDRRRGPVDRKKLRTGCRDLVRYSGRCPHRSHPTRAGHRSRWSAAPGGARPSPPTARGRRWWSCSRPG
jgi:hypothetical protein